VIYPIAKNGEEKVWQRQFSRVKNEYKDYIFENNTIKIPIVDEKTPFSLWAEDKHSNVEFGTNLVKKLFDGKKVFDYSKSIYTVKDIISMVSDRGIVLDFFSGSGTTAHAVMQLNSEEEGNTKFIMVQLPEKVTDENEAFNLGYKTICDIGEERIRRAGAQVEREWKDKNKKDCLLSESGEFNVDTGFKVFKLDTTNINPWDNTKEYDEESLFSTATVFKLDRDNEDILYEIMLKYGVFDQLVTKKVINGKSIYQVGEGNMIVCLENHLTDADVQSICALAPQVVVFKELGFKDDNAKINAEYNLKKAGVGDIKCI
jgi:adenine-specific DNA-methyltransferase